MANKLTGLVNILKRMRFVVLAYSGGVDSTFLLKVSLGALGKDKVIAVTGDSLTYPARELGFARKMARVLGARHLVIHTDEFNDRRFRSNPPERCYSCKKELFFALKRLAKRYKCGYVIDASNLDDKKDYRPGSRAKKELGVRSPLQEAGFSKADIRGYSKKLGLPTWDKPSLACLASRIPYGHNITPEKLRRVEKAEEFLSGLGFKQVRVRDYQGLARIEVEKNKIARLLTKGRLVVDKLKQLGYNYITVDLEGFRSGSMNEILNKE